MNNLEYIKALISIAEKAALVLAGIVASIAAWLFNSTSSAEAYQIAIASLLLIIFSVGFIISTLIPARLARELRR